MKMSQKPFSIYIHWPYCLSKCPYCDFASCPTHKIDEEFLWQGYERDILSLPEGRPVHTIFFGGGTPSLMSGELCQKILNLIRQRHPIETDCEMTMEANPDAIDITKMESFRLAGINRLSIGVQSLLEDDLRFLGRRHSRKTALDRIEEAKQIFSELSIDLIYARPNQTKEAWQEELSEALSLGLNHYSLYQLSVEEGTPFAQRGIRVPDEDVAADLYRMTDDIMTQAGLPAYEVSNYATIGHECRHNLTYWRSGDYGAVGPAAHGRMGLWAIQNPPNVKVWAEKGGRRTKLTLKERQIEYIMMGMRLRQEGYPISELNQSGVNEAIRRQWGYEKEGCFFATLEGVLMLNQLILLLLT